MSRGFDDEPDALLNSPEGHSSKTKAFGHASRAVFSGKIKNMEGSVKDDIPNLKKASQRRMIRNTVSAEFSDKVHQKVSEYGDDNVGVEAADRTGEAAEQAVFIRDELHEERKIRQAIPPP